MLEHMEINYLRLLADAQEDSPESSTVANELHNWIRSNARALVEMLDNNTDKIGELQGKLTDAKYENEKLKKAIDGVFKMQRNEEPMFNRVTYSVDYAMMSEESFETMLRHMIFELARKHKSNLSVYADGGRRWPI